MFIKFPSIEQFRNTVAEVNRRANFVGLDENGEPKTDPTKTKPKIKFTGTVKVHGTNAGITQTSEGNIFCQSRTRALIAPADNDGFRVFVESLPGEVLTEMFSQAKLFAESKGISCTDKNITIFGEWAGKGIQSGVAVTSIDKFFYVFALRVGEVFVDYSCITEKPAHRIFNAKHNFPVWEIEIDFNDPVQMAQAQNLLVEFTEKVEKLCPVGARFGVSGVGEGIVWTCDQHELNFKVKGTEHSSSHVKVLASADVEKIATVKAFVDSVVSNSRIEQAIRTMKEEGKSIDRTITGDIVRWVVNDVLKEESDTISANSLDVKSITAAVGVAARTAFFKKLG